jgi:hypothetical protein
MATAKIAVEISGKTIIAVHHDGNLYQPNAVITVEGCGESGLVKGILRMVNESQCSECGKFNGLHGEVFHISDMNNGEVNGVYKMCTHSKDKA